MTLNVSNQVSSHRGRMGHPAAPSPLAAFDHKIAALERAVANGVPGAREELAAVRRDRNGIRTALADAERQLAGTRDPKARQALRKKLNELKKFGFKVAGMNPTERQDLQNFFRLAKEDPARFKRFVDRERNAPEPKRLDPAPTGFTPGGNHAPSTTGPAPVAPAPTGASPGIQAAIDFGLSQQGAPYVGGASPFRFGTPGDGKTYQMAGQKAYVSPAGVIGYDCSGLVVTMLKKAGIDISHLASSRAMKAGLPEVSKSALQPGDLLVKNGHVAMYIGDGKMIEAVPGGVTVSPATKYINDPAYSGHRPG